MKMKISFIMLLVIKQKIPRIIEWNYRLYTRLLCLRMNYIKMKKLK